MGAFALFTEHSSYISMYLFNKHYTFLFNLNSTKTDHLLLTLIVQWLNNCEIVLIKPRCSVIVRTCAPYLYIGIGLFYYPYRSDLVTRDGNPGLLGKEMALFNIPVYHNE